MGNSWWNLEVLWTSIFAKWLILNRGEARSQKIPPSFSWGSSHMNDCHIPFSGHWGIQGCSQQPDCWWQRPGCCAAGHGSVYMGSAVTKANLGPLAVCWRGFLKSAQPSPDQGYCSLVSETKVDWSKAGNFHQYEQGKGEGSAPPLRVMI